MSDNRDLQANGTLVLFAHPALEKSRINVHLANAAASLEGITFHDLYEEYPEFDVDVAREQRLLQEHDVLVLQHPVFWYSVPALLKQWTDLVLEHGWAYGSEGTALAGKKVLSVMTTGGREEAYQAEGYNRFTIRELFRPVEQTFRLCGMEYLPPFIAHGTHQMTTESVGAHVEDYRRLLEAIRDGRIDWQRARRSTRINEDLEAIVRGSA